MWLLMLTFTPRGPGKCFRTLGSRTFFFFFLLPLSFPDFIEPWCQNCVPSWHLDDVKFSLRITTVQFWWLSWYWTDLVHFVHAPVHTCCSAAVRDWKVHCCAAVYTTTLHSDRTCLATGLLCGALCPLFQGPFYLACDGNATTLSWLFCPCSLLSLDWLKNWYQWGWKVHLSHRALI